MTMWRKSRLELVEKHEVPLNFDQDNEVFSSSQVCLITVLRLLQPKETKKPTVAIVANVHLSFNTKRGDVKLAQTYYILSCIAEIKKYYVRTEQRTITFLCGDFNCTPSSAIFHLIVRGTYDCHTLQTNIVCIGMRLVS